MRQRGEEVFFLTGTDEHGEPVAQAAEREGVTPKELADRNAQRFQALMPRINVSNDFFIRTSDPRHKAARPGGHAARPRQRARLQGHVRGLVLPPLRGLQDGGRRSGRTTRARSTRSRSTASTRRTGSSASRRFQEPLERLYAERPGLRRARASAYNEALAFINGGLQDVSLSPRASSPGASRSRGTRTHVFYVWFDALLNYYTALVVRARRRGPDGPLLARDASTSSARTSSSSTPSSGRRC